jgi:hypothetical protein
MPPRACPRTPPPRTRASSRCTRSRPRSRTAACGRNAKTTGRTIRTQCLYAMAKKKLTQAGGVFQAMQMSNGGMSRPWMQRTWQVYVSVSDARCHGNGKHTQHVVGQQINSTSLRVKTGTGGGRAKEEASKLRHRAGRVGRRPRRPRPATAHRERLHLSGCIPCVYLSRSRRREVAAPSSRRARHLPAQQISPWRRCTTQLPLQDCSGIHRGSGQGRLA